MLNKIEVKPSSITLAVRCGIACLGLAHSVSQAATLVVTTNEDNFLVDVSGCSLREAVMAINNGANANGCVNVAPQIPFGSGDQILVNPSALANNTITLLGSEILISKSMVIQGFDGLTIDGDQKSRVLNVSDSTVLLRNLTIANGSIEGVGGGIRSSNSEISLLDSIVSNNTGFEYGGGIYASSSTISLNNSTISNNSVTENIDGDLGFGGGIYASAASQINLIDSDITNNYAAEQGGGLHIQNSGLSTNGGLASDNSAASRGGAISLVDASASINEFSINNNSAGNTGGGVYVNESFLFLNRSTLANNSTTVEGGGIIAFNTTLVVAESTLSGNSARFGGGISARNSQNINFTHITVTDNSATFGGGVFGEASSFKISGSIFANSLTGNDCEVGTSSLAVDATSIIQDGSCNTSRRVDPQLGPLADNGGPTLTHAISPTSPARDTGDLANCQTEDQRGQVRDEGDGACDVGAIEFNANDTFGEPEESANFYIIPLATGKTVVVPL